VSGGDGYLPNCGSSVLRLTWFRMGLWFTDGPARRAWLPGVAEMDLRAIGEASGRQRSGAGPSLRDCRGKGLGRAGCRRFAPPSVSQKVPYFLASPKDPRFGEENECLERKGAGCGHRFSGSSCSGGNVGRDTVLARTKTAYGRHPPGRTGNRCLRPKGRGLPHRKCSPPRGCPSGCCDPGCCI
jgi:hypothetical protein